MAANLPSAKLSIAPSLLRALILSSASLLPFSLSAGLQAQTSGPSAPTSEKDDTPVLHPATDQIPIEFVARDKKKRPVLNLTPADFSVTDSGVPVQFANLRLVTLQNGGAASISLLFDHLSPESAKTARAYTARLLATAPLQYSFAVFGLDRGLRLYSPYTSDRAALSTAIGSALSDTPLQQLTPAEQQVIAITQTGSLPSGAHAGVEDRAQAKTITSLLEDSQKIAQDQHAPVALAGMLALAHVQQEHAGRRIIIYFSEGMRSNSTIAGAAQEVVEAADRSGVSIYPVDTNGVDTKSFDMLTMMYQQPGGLPVRLSPGVAGITTAPNMSRIELMQSSTEDAKSVSSLARENAQTSPGMLSLLANGTGGFVLSAGDRMNDPLKHLVSDMSTYYVADFAPNVATFDGRFHPLSLQAVKPGVFLRSGAGYFALPPDAVETVRIRPFEAPLFKLLADSANPADVEFQQAVLHMAAHAEQSTDELVVDVPIANLNLRKDTDTKLYSEHVSLLAEVKDSAGVVVERFSQDIAHNGALESLDTARASHVVFQRHFSASPGKYTLETAVFDANDGKAGVRRSDFTIAAASTGPWISDITLVKRTEPFTGTPDPLDPMNYSGARIVPNLVGQISAGTPAISFFFATGSDAKAGAEGHLDLDILKEDKTISHASMPVADQPPTGQSVHLATIQSAKLSPGLYRAVLHYAQGTQTATRELPFMIIGTGTDGSASDASDSDEESNADRADLPSDLDSGDGRYTPLAPSPSFHPPSEKYRDSLLDSARERALGYLNMLMNFKCIEVTDRFVDRKGTGNWSRHDKIAELVTYENHEESRKILEVNGNPDNTQSADMKSARLEGEFGGVLEIIFAPAAKADITWKETGSLDGAPVQVYSYHVDAKNSRFSVTPLPAPQKIVSFHGLLFIDAATRGIRRVTMEAEDIPSDSPVHASALSIDYDYVSINGHDYLMPVRGELRMQLGKTEKILHRIEFRDYHRFGSEVRIVGVEH